MLVRCFWKQCHLFDHRDAVWVEATPVEAGARIFPRLSAAEITESRTLAERGEGIARTLGRPSRPFCFLVSTDLSCIRPSQVHFPFHQLWNAYSPFRAMPERMVESLEDVSRLELPAGDDDADDDDEACRDEGRGLAGARDADE